MAGFGSAPVFVKVVLILSLVGFALHLIGFATSYWRSFEIYNRQFGRAFGRFERRTGYTYHEGLWKGCHESHCASLNANAAWFEATQAFETLGFIASLAALVLIILYIFVPATSGKKIVFILSMLACFAAAGCIILGVIIYGSKVEHNLSWSFVLCTIAGIIFGVSGILLVIDTLKR